MRLKEFLSEADVIKGNFGKGQPLDGVEIPKGYKSFYTKKIGNKDSAQIIGVKADGKEVVLSTTSSSKLANTLAKYYTTGKSAEDIKQISMSDTFGSSGYRIIKDLGFEFSEKVAHFTDVRLGRGIGAAGLAQIKKEFKKNGFELKEYSSQEIYGKHVNDEDLLDYTTKNTKWRPEEDIFIVVFNETENKYIADQTGAKSYIRFWLYI